MAIPNNGDRSEPLLSDQWREQLENGCAERQESEAFWLEIEQKGRQLMENSEELEAGRKGNLGKPVVFDHGDRKEECPQNDAGGSVDLLAEERENR